MTNPKEQMNALERNLNEFAGRILNKKVNWDEYGEMVELKTDGKEDAGIKFDIKIGGYELEVPFIADEVIRALPFYRYKTNSIGISFLFPSIIQAFVPVSSITRKPVEGDEGGLQDHSFQLKRSGEKIGEITYFIMPEKSSDSEKSTKENGLDGKTSINIK